QPPRRRRVRPERSISASSMLSAPSAIAKSKPITFRPALRAPGRCGRSSTKRSTKSWIPNRCASVAASAIPASDTTRSSSKTTRTRSSPTGPSSCTIKVTSSAGPRLHIQLGKAPLRRSFLLQHRTASTHHRGGSRLSAQQEREGRDADEREPAPAPRCREVAAVRSRDPYRDAEGEEEGRRDATHRRSESPFSQR